MIKKRCKVCDLDKELSEFYKNRNVCKKCISDSRKDYYEENKEIVLERNRTYKTKNKEKVKNKEKEYRETHKDYYNNYNKKYRLENIEYYIEYSRNYYKNNKLYFKNYHTVNSDQFIEMWEEFVNIHGIPKGFED